MTACKASGLIKPRGTQRTDSTHVLAAIRTLHRLECVLETMHMVLNHLTERDPTWVRRHIPFDWYERYGLRADRSRLPKEASKREALALTIGADGYQLMTWVFAPDGPHHLRQLPAMDVLRQIWIQQFSWCTIPGAEEICWRTTENEPPSALLIQSPYDLAARYSSKRDTHWVGGHPAGEVHIPESCDDDRPDLITQVITTAATTQDSVMGPTIQQDLADRDLLPGTHLLDSGYVDSQLLVTAQAQHKIDVVGPAFGSYSRQRMAGQGYDLHTFVIDWDMEHARCGHPVGEGHTSVKWTPGLDVSGDPVIRIRFDKATGRACPVRGACTWAKDAPRQLTVRPKEQHVAIQSARQRQETADGHPVGEAQYAMRAGVESSISQGIRRFDMRRSRYVGLIGTHLQQLLVAVAMNLVRVVSWLWNETGGEQRRPPGHFARLAPRPLSRKALVC